mmetsp:Transcript_124760/g.216324  ORF Transcript_124760/g.216324 Transcript_124760/m.216324 type:complete len:766 (-) Transcript_124760:45-2342(-)
MEEEFAGDALPAQHGGWLPPLVATESASAKLIKGLRQLDPNRNFGQQASQFVPGERGAVRPATSGERSLKSISRYGLRANDRAAEADAEMTSNDANGNSESSAAWLIGMSCGRDIAAANKAFENIVAGIDSALAGGYCTTKTVKRDETIQERVDLHAVRHYKVPLPSRPTVVTVIVTRTSGAAPALWASTSAERPSSKNYELKGKASGSLEERIVYEHAISADEGEENATIDRRQAVPRCRELYVTVEAEAGECAYRLHVNWTNIKIVLTRNEISSQVQKIRRGWEARLGELQREPGQREQFEEHVRTLQDIMYDKKKELYGGKDFTQRNLRDAPVSDTRARIVKLQNQALTRCQRTDLARAAREKMERETMRNNVAWLNKSEIRRQQREQQELQRQQEQREKDRQCEWLQRLAAIAFVEQTKQRSKELMEMQAITRERMRAAGLIHRWVLQRLCYRQRNKLYKNVIHLRMALAGYVRHCRPAALCASEPVIRMFLDQYAFARESPSITGGFRRFRARVVMIQKWWFQLKTIRLAYISLFMPMWCEILTRVYKEMAVEQVRQEEVRAQEEETARKKAMQGRVTGVLEVPSIKNPRRGSNLLQRQSTMRSIRTRGSLEDDGPMTKEELLKHIEATQDKIPSYISHMVLKDYIKSMQRSHQDRLAQWKSQIRKTQLAHDVEVFSGRTDHQHALKKPRVVYIDPDELEAEVKKTIAIWDNGGYKHIRHNRLRLVKRVFNKWYKMQQILAAGAARIEALTDGKDQGLRH